MAKKPEELNLYQKLARVRRRVEVMKKDKDGFNYKYTADEAIRAQITGIMDQLHISLVPGVVPGTAKVTPYSYTKTKLNRKTGEVYDEKNSEIITQADMVYTWVNDDNPAERIEVPWVTVGMQEDASQSFGSGLTYTYRYFLLKYFGVSTTEDDPDNWRSRQREAAEAEGREAAERCIEETDRLCRLYLADHPDEKEKVKSFFCRYARDGDFKKIKEPVLAAKMLDDFKKMIGQEEKEE